MTVNRIAAGVTMCCAVLFVSACGGTPASVGASRTSTTATSGGPGGDAAGGGRGFPGATGLLAQIDGKTLQVQGASAQTAVTYSASTTFTNTVAAKLSDVVVGVCVQARSAQPVSGAGGAPPAAAPRTTGPIVAATVQISPAVNGTCSAQGGLRVGGARPPGGGGQPTGPAGMPSSGRTRGQGAGGSGFGGFGAFGKVTAVSGAGFTVDSSRPQNGTAVPTTETVQTPAGTKYTRTGAANAQALVVGVCVTALGKADDTGSIAATSIALQPAENGSCSSGFGGGFGGGGAGGGAAPPRRRGGALRAP